MIQKAYSKHFYVLVIFACAMMMFSQSASAKMAYTPLRGSSSFAGCGYDMLFDRNTSTKWCSASTHEGYDNGWWVIFKTSQPFCPTSYIITTGDDTANYPQRNWKTWKIYGANFNNDKEALKDASDWVLLDEKKNIGLDVIPAASFAEVAFDMSGFNTEAYEYFMIYVNEVQALNPDGGGYLHQMAEFSFVESGGETHEEVTYSALNGTKSGFGDGFSYPSLIDKNKGTKWCATIDHEGYDNGWWIVFKSSEPVSPMYYELTTGDDAKNYYQRNWKSWKIYAANFGADEEATKGAEGWVLIDSKENIGLDQLPAANLITKTFGFSTEVTNEYSYFKIEVTEILDGSCMQMSEFSFGFSWDLADMCDTKYNDYIRYMKEVGQKSLLGAFVSKVEELKIVDSYQAYLVLVNEIEEMLAVVKANIAAYHAYMNEAEHGTHMLEDYADQLSEAGKAKLTSYLKETVQPGTQFANGSYPYIIANCTLSTEEIQAETASLQKMIQGAIKQDDEEPFDVTYTPLAGLTFRNSYQYLFDGDAYTSWDANATDALYGFEHGWWTIFKTSKAIKPTLYFLTTSNMTSTSNWKAWRIYGANFNEDDVSYYTSEDWTSVKDGWVLIDEKRNIGSDQLPLTPYTTCCFNLSEIVTEPYQYFKIVITENLFEDDAAMSEFRFGNNATVARDREEYIADCEAFDTDVVAQKSLIDQYKELLPQLKACDDAPRMLDIYRQLKSLQNAILASTEAYTLYQETISYIQDYLGEATDMTPSPQLNALKTYLNEYIEPNQTYPYGSYVYIIQNRLLGVAEVQNATAQASQMLEDAINVTPDMPIVLSGTPDWQNDKTYVKGKLFDGDRSTKWFMSPVDSNHPAYIIFKMPQAITPAMYTLVTGDDTDKYADRNWKAWQLYAANFESDEAATKDSEEWTLIDQRENIGQDRLPASGLTECYFGFTEGIPDSYQYFKLVITEAYSGQNIQMAEMTFGTEEDYEVFVENKMQEMEIDLDIIAQVSLLAEYETMWNALEEVEDLEEFIARANELLQLKREIYESEVQYLNYLDKREEILAYIDEHPLQGEELQTLLTYLNDYEEPGDVYPNGTFQHVYENHELDNTAIATEISFMEELLRQAIKTGAAAGSDVTMLIENPDFINGLNGWSGSWFLVEGVAERCPVAWCRTREHGSLSQTLTGLKNGIYEVSMHGMFAVEDDYEACAYGATLFAGESIVPLKMAQEDVISFSDAVDLENCYITDVDNPPYDITLQDGYVPTSTTGCSYAFSAGRYENRILAEVKDGTLTLGINAPGIGAGKICRTFAGRFHLTYCGTVEEAGEQITAVLEGQKERAQFLTAYDFDSGSDFASAPSYSSEIRNALQEAASAPSQGGISDMESIARFCDLFRQYDACRKAYYAYLQALAAMDDVVYSDVVYPFSDEEKTAYGEFSAAIWYNIMDGKYTTEEALSQIDLKQSPFYIACYGVQPELVNRAYQIGNVDELRWVAYQVNSGNGKLKACLKNDIDMSTIGSWIPIGTSDKPFAGTFDGQGHAFVNFTMNVTSGDAGLFGYISGATVRNFTIDGTMVCAGAVNAPIASAKASLIEGVHSSLRIDATAAGVTHTAGVVGDLQENSVVDRCAFDGSISVGTDNYDCFGGIAGYTNTGTITNCANYGTITFAHENCYAGGMFGYVNNTNFGGFSNCLAVGTVKRENGESKVAGALCGWLRNYNASVVANNYWLAGCAERASGIADLEVNKRATTEELASGAVCFALNQGQAEDVWFQTIGEDPYPVLDATHGRVVFKDGKYVNDGSGVETIHNVQVIIHNGENEVYDLSGRKVSNDSLPKGVYIVNGQKTLVK